MNGPLFGIDVSNLVRVMGRVSSWEQTNRDSLTKLPSHAANLRIKMAILEIFPSSPCLGKYFDSGDAEWSYRGYSSTMMTRR